MSTYLFGDVQGCWKELKALLKVINYQPGKDRLGFVGDILNRGPDSLDVVHFIQDLDDPLFVLGNHEMYFIITARGHIPLDRYDHTLDALLNAPDCDEITRWLMQKPLIQRMTDEAGVLVHAGIPPQWTIDEAIARSDDVQQLMQQPGADAFFAVCFGDQPDQWDPTLTGHDRTRYIINALTRMRFCTAGGQLDLIEKSAAHAQPDTYKPWFEWRQSDPTPIYFGHWARLRGQCNRADTYALDTGCVHGGTLTAIRLEDKRLFQL
jgi:bis(5'-nucleosyl)-tetraphosphatase (symmetrical)